ncbi:hypothetical protein BKA61DRAFT_617851, partial [Leptodontidium sp. MPI-SDFR-AT-0119]
MEESSETTAENQIAPQESDTIEVQWPADVEREAQSGPTRDPNTSTRTTTNEAITIEFSNSPRTSTNKTRKILPARKRARKDTETAGDISRVGAIEFTGRNGGKGTWLEEVAWLIAELKTGQEELKVEQRTLMTQNRELQAVNHELKAGNEELKTHTKALIEELAEVKTQLAETRAQLADVISISGSFTRIGSTGESPAPSYASVLTGSEGSTGGPPPQTYASVLTKSTNASSSISQHAAGAAPSHTRSRGSILPGMTIDTRRMKDKTVITVDNISDTEKRIKALIHATNALKDVQVVGIQVRGQNVRVLTSTEKEAALLRANDKWVNQVFEGARTRGEDWHPVKIDDVVKASVVNDDGYTIKESFAERFCMENGATAVMKAFWLSKGNKRTGSMAVFLASEEEAQRMISNRLVKVGGQIAFAGEFQRVARPARCYNCNQYGHYQSR